MIETRISIGSINTVNFYEVNNTKQQIIKSFFPKMIISARGNKINVKGNTKDLIIFTEKINTKNTANIFFKHYIINQT